MVVRIIYLTIRHYLVTIILLILVYVIFVTYFHVNETVLFLLTVLLTWLQPMIDKVREIKRQVELEAHPRNEAIHSTSTRIDWGLIVSKARTPLLIISAIIFLLAFLIYIYLFVRLRHWL
jgi:UDP-N-acetylmuramyl pentapeptide phosphotransferase/UDP-N-acetylglucosamine-1-phosphate transferase